VVGAAFVLGNMKAAASAGRAAPSKAAVKGARKDVKGGKKGQKQCPRCVAIVASDDGDNEKADDSIEKYVTTDECNLMHQM
jgi:hypothetical protein